MAVGKNKILVYADWLDNFEDLTDEELGKLMRHFFMYINDMNPVLDDRFLKIAWKPIESTLKRDLKKWEQKAENSRKNGALGGRPRNNPEEPKKPSGLKQNPEEPKKPVIDSVSVIDSDNDSVIVTDINKKDSKEFENSSPSYFKNNNTKNLKKENSKKVAAKKVFSEDVEKCYLECLEFFPDHLRPKNGNVDSWKDTIEKLNRLDKIPFELIIQITQKTRGDDFWSKNFLSLTKLRKKNKDNIYYIIVFNEQIKKKNEQHTVNRQTRETFESNFRGW